MKKFYLQMIVVFLLFVAIASIFLLLLYLEGERRRDDAQYQILEYEGDVQSPFLICPNIYFPAKNCIQ